MLFYFLVIPCTLVFVAVAFLCIKSISAGIFQLNAGVRDNNDVLKRRGRAALISAVLVLALCGYLYWKYLWDEVWNFFEASFSNL